MGDDDAHRSAHAAESLGRALRARPHWIALGSGAWLSLVGQLLARSPADSLHGSHRYFGFDFLSFGSAARVLLARPAALYDTGALSRAASAWLGYRVEALPFANPPLFAAEVVPFALLPFAAARVAWCACAAIACWVAARTLAPSARRGALAVGLLAFPPFAILIGAGQSTWLAVLFTSLAAAFVRDDRALSAGACVGALVYRPHWFLPMLVVMTFAARRGRARLVLGALGVSAPVCAASYFAAPDAWRAFAAFARDVLPHFKEWARFQTATGVGVRDFYRVLFPGAGAARDAASLATIGVGLCAGALVIARARPPWAWTFAAGSALTLWASPHVSAYDWTLIGPPLLALWESDERARSLVLGLAALVGLGVVALTLSDWQIAVLGRGLHLPTIVLSYVTYVVVTSAAAGRRPS